MFCFLSFSKDEKETITLALITTKIQRNLHEIKRLSASAV